MRYKKPIVVIGIAFLLSLIGLLAWGLTSTTTTPNNPSTVIQPIPTSTVSSRYWIITASALNKIATSTQALHAIASDTIFVPGSNSESLTNQTSALHIIKTQSFTSEQAIAKAINNHTISPGTKAILYDNENWSLTPLKEQANPLHYYKLAWGLVQKAGYTFIGTPVSKTDRSIAAEVASYVNVLDIQSQYDQSSSSAYSTHVLSLAIAAKKTDPNLVVLSGLSTNPSAGIPTSNQLVDDATSVKSQVQGYWLNIPSPGTACPGCHLPEPEIAIQFLIDLGP